LCMVTIGAVPILFSSESGSGDNRKHWRHVWMCMDQLIDCDSK
jgi:hypothetical protein